MLASSQTLRETFSKNDEAETVEILFPRTYFCNECLEITVTSSGGAAEHQPDTLGTFTRAGSLWENIVPFWMKADTKQFITPNPNSNPIMYYLMWEISSGVDGLSYGKNILIWS